ncbi:Protein of unknown function (DUF2637) [Parafrankia irregularis]|uniref:DUF2637 domain-containing protein n=1 Tax=Parafrankia irregularis TaxID=795642 RepID=A0A0S4R0V9_9ACTN|nr:MULTISPECIES: hypothetical protein [Parafrankia]MBE3206754.1 hypothetical protein [Parafrankia sp. CH37]CUU60828.1 Protein of unknown function (DUF2637) [Parafrankia irregularis]
MSAAPARWERAALTVLPAALGAGVFAVAFVHVHDVARWAGQPEWASWMLACTGELMAIAAGAAILACRRHGVSIFWPVVVLLAAIVFSGACNLQAAGADALQDDPGQWVQIMAIWPVIAFGLVSLLKVSTPHGDHEDQADVAQAPRAAAEAEAPQRTAVASAVVPAAPPIVRTVETAPPPVVSVSETTNETVTETPAPSVSRSRPVASRSDVSPSSRSRRAGANKTQKAPVSQREAIAAYINAQLDADPEAELSGAELDRRFGTKNYGARVLREVRAARAAEAARIAGEADELTGWVPASPELITVPAAPALAPADPERDPVRIAAALSGGTEDLVGAGHAH